MQPEETATTLSNIAAIIVNIAWIFLMICIGKAIGDWERFERKKREIESARFLRELDRDLAMDDDKFDWDESKFGPSPYKRIRERMNLGRYSDWKDEDEKEQMGFEV